MKLTDTERRLLPNLELNAETPLAQLAKSLNVSVNTVRHAISNLTEKGILRHYPFIDVFPLGYRLFNISLSLRAKQIAEQDRLLKTIIAHPQVSWVCELGGEYRYIISFVGRQSSELLSFLETVSAAAPGIIQRKAVMDQLALTIFPAKFLAPKVLGAPFIGWGGDTQPFDADHDDYRILKSMMSGYSSMREMARNLGMAHSSLYHRLNRLRQAGVFKGFIYLRSIHALNHSEFKLNIAVADRTPAIRERLFAFAKAHPQVIVFVELMGDWDFEMDVEVETPADAGLVYDQLRARFADEITDLKIVPILRELKVACFPLEPQRRTIANPQVNARLAL